MNFSQPKGWTFNLKQNGKQLLTNRYSKHYISFFVINSELFFWWVVCPKPYPIGLKNTTTYPFSEYIGTSWTLIKMTLQNTRNVFLQTFFGKS